MDKIKHPFIISVVGPKRTGKTYFINKLLRDHLLDKFRYVVIFSPTAELSGDFDDVMEDRRATFIKKCDTKEYEECARKLFDQLEGLKKSEGKAPNTLLILDDCGTDPILNANSVLDKYSIRHRHASLSILAVGHSLRGTCGLPKAFRQQLDMAIFFNPTSMSEMEAILKEVLFSQHLKAARQRAVEVFNEDYNFIVWTPSAPYKRKLMINFTDPLISEAVVNGETKKVKSRKRRKQINGEES